MGKRDFARFGFKMSLGRIFHIALGPWLRVVILTHDDAHLRLFGLNIITDGWSSGMDK